MLCKASLLCKKACSCPRAQVKSNRRTMRGALKMKSRICEMLGVDFPLVAFSHCRDVVAAVSRAGGFRVLGATAFSPHQLDLELKWIDEHIDGKPYGVDVLIPENLSIKHERGITTHSLAGRIPPQHREFVRELLIRHGVELANAPQEGIYRPGAGLS